MRGVDLTLLILHVPLSSTISSERVILSVDWIGVSLIVRLSVSLSGGQLGAVLCREATCFYLLARVSVLVNLASPPFMTSSPNRPIGARFGRIANEPALRHIVALLRSPFSY